MKENPYYYLGVNPTVDLVIINHLNEVLMVKRNKNSDACPGMWALPGGFINTEAKPPTQWEAGAELPEVAAKREVKEETNLDLKSVVVEPVGIYEGNNRDPRDNPVSWSKSHAFFHRIDKETFESNKDTIKGMDDVELTDWKSIPVLLSMDLAFDHKQILIDALTKYCPELLTENTVDNNSMPKKLKR